MTATTLSALKAAQRSLLLKPLDAAVFLAPYGTVAPMGSFTDANGILQTLPSAFQSVGLIDKKTGVAFSRGITAAPIESYGELQAVRNDITSDITALEFEAQQNATALNLNLTTSATVASMQAAANGEVFFAQPSAENITYYSAVVIGKDGTDAMPIYVIKILPKVAVSKFGGEQWVPTGVLSQKLTLVAFKDDASGFAVAHTYAGKGWQQVLAQTGMPYTITSLTATIAGPTTLAKGNTSQSTQVVVKDQWGGVVSPTLLNCTGVTALTATATVSTGGLVTPTAAGTGGTGAVNVALNLPSGWPASTATATSPAITVA